MRAYNYLSFLISSRLDGDLDHLEYITSSSFFNQEADFYTLGSRFFYPAFLMFIWLFGPIPLFVMSLMLLMALKKMDFRKSDNRGILAPKLHE